MKNDELTEKIIACFYKAHNELGCGFVERVYSNALEIVLSKEGINFEKEKKYEVLFEGKKVGEFKVDFVVENKVILELKAIEGSMLKIFESQLISYLKTSKLKVGLLVNFDNIRCQIRRLMLSP